MTDESELSPEQEARIHSALAAARVSEPMPDAVVARLDAALADLSRDRATGGADPVSVTGSYTRGSHTTGPTSLDARRARRGRWILFAGAASVAAVVVLSVPGLRPSMPTSGSADSSTTADSAAGETEQSPGAPLASSSPGRTPGSEKAATPQAALPRVTRAAFRSDVRRLLADPSAGLASAWPSGADTPGGCSTDTVTPGVVRRIPVLLDQTPAVLELFGIRGGARVVRAVSCDGTQTLASTRVPVP